MADGLPPLAELLPSVGPWLLLALAVAETSFVTGLVVPAGVATAFGAFLAAEGLFELPDVVLYAGAGALLGDSVGFWVGRRGGGGLLRGDGRIGVLARRHLPRTRELFDRHALYAVSVARLVPFVRTLMPMTAGASAVSYPRFLLFDLVGVAGWVAEYVAIGWLAGESWRWVSGVVGTGWAVVFLVVALMAWLAARRRALRGAAQEGSDPARPADAEGDEPTRRTGTRAKEGEAC